MKQFLLIQLLFWMSLESEWLVPICKIAPPSVVVWFHFIHKGSQCQGSRLTGSVVTCNNATSMQHQKVHSFLCVINFLVTLVFSLELPAYEICLCRVWYLIQSKEQCFNMLNLMCILFKLASRTFILSVSSFSLSVCATCWWMTFILSSCTHNDFSRFLGQ